MRWHQVTLTNDEIVSGKEFQLREAFSKLFMAAGGPQKAALFCSNLRERGDSVFYFSPSSMVFARTIVANYSGKPCDQPPKNICLLVGHANAKEELIG